MIPTTARSRAPLTTQAQAKRSQFQPERDGDDGFSLLQAAEGMQAEQQAGIEAAPVEQTYQESLAAYVQGKQDQVTRIEDQLENLIDQQRAALQRTQGNAPGVLSMPGTKRAWQAQQAQQQARLLALTGRLEAVREIKEGMGMHSPRIEELATRKMRAEHPEMAGEWDAMREAARRHELHMRKEAQEKKAHAQERGGRGQGLSLAVKSAGA